MPDESKLLLPFVDTEEDPYAASRQAAQEYADQLAAAGLEPGGEDPDGQQRIFDFEGGEEHPPSPLDGAVTAFLVAQTSGGKWVATADLAAISGLTLEREASLGDFLYGCQQVALDAQMNALTMGITQNTAQNVVDNLMRLLPPAVAATTMQQIEERQAKAAEALRNQTILQQAARGGLRTPR